MSETQGIYYEIWLFTIDGGTGGNLPIGGKMCHHRFGRTTCFKNAFSTRGEYRYLEILD